LSDGPGTFAPFDQEFVNPEPRRVTVADLNLDGHLDIVAASFTANHLAVLPGLGGAQFSEYIPLGLGAGIYAVIAADLDGDGAPAPAAVDHAAGELVIIPGLGLQDIVAVHRFDVGDGPFDLAAGDLDGDGHLDIVTADA